MAAASSLLRAVSSTTMIVVFLLVLLACPFGFATAQQQQHSSSVAQQWNKALLKAIRMDLARPPVHARNLFHLSAAMWDAWVAYDDGADSGSKKTAKAIPWLHREKTSPQRASKDMTNAARHEAISYAAYRILVHRFTTSPGSGTSLPMFDELLQNLGYSVKNNATAGDSPMNLGNRIADTYIQFGLSDGANELEDYNNVFYEPINPPLFPDLSGNPTLTDPNRWQPLALEFFMDQSGNVIPGGFPDFQSAEWGVVAPFALTSENLDIYKRDGREYWVYYDPGPPPYADTTAYKEEFENVLLCSGLLDSNKSQLIDISPASRGNNRLGMNDGSGHNINPVTGQPYVPQMIPEGDYYRVLAEFWADGPDSETPPGHWFTIANKVSDHPQLVRRIGGTGPVLDTLEWDVKLYLTLGGAAHDAAIAAWSVKGWYDYIRPISAIRYLAGLGQRSDPDGLSYNPEGIALHPNAIELVTQSTIMTGAKHEHLSGFGRNVGKVAVYAWRGPDFISDPDTDAAGVGWILAENWWPYQRPSFVTPPFAAYVSGHSTFSRAAARALTEFTGSKYFPGGIGEFSGLQNEFLVFEVGPSVNVTLQWATYFDAADECGLSRIYGGIHPSADDIPGRFMGDTIGAKAVQNALRIFTSASARSTHTSATVPAAVFGIIALILTM
jgi:hypothetical protein